MRQIAKPGGTVVEVPGRATPISTASNVNRTAMNTRARPSRSLPPTPRGPRRASLAVFSQDGECRSSQSRTDLIRQMAMIKKLYVARPIKTPAGSQQGSTSATQNEATVPTAITPDVTSR